VVPCIQRNSFVLAGDEPARSCQGRPSDGQSGHDVREVGSVTPVDNAATRDYVEQMGARLARALPFLHLPE